MTPQVLLLGTIDIAFGIVYWLVFVRCARVLDNAIGRRGVRRMLDRVIGGVFLGLGVTLATAEAR
jgi:threonine/homoserine/homoserine lactone efflux protein